MGHRTWDIPTFDIVRCTLAFPQNVKCWDVPCTISNALVQQPNHPLTNCPNGSFAFARFSTHARRTHGYRSRLQLPHLLNESLPEPNRTPPRLTVGFHSV